MIKVKNMYRRHFIYLSVSWDVCEGKNCHVEMEHSVVWRQVRARHWVPLSCFLSAVATTNKIVERFFFFPLNSRDVQGLQRALHTYGRD